MPIKQIITYLIYDTFFSHNCTLYKPAGAQYVIDMILNVLLSDMKGLGNVNIKYVSSQYIVLQCVQFFK